MFGLSNRTRVVRSVPAIDKSREEAIGLCLRRGPEWQEVRRTQESQRLPTTRGDETADARKFLLLCARLATVVNSPHPDPTLVSRGPMAIRWPTAGLLSGR